MNKILLLASFLVFIFSSLCAQGWKQIYSSHPGIEIVNANDGGYIFMQDGLTRKINGAGYTVWTSDFSGQNLVVTNDDAYAFLYKNADDMLAWAKFDNAGNLLDSVAYPRPVEYLPLALEEISNGDFLISAMVNEDTTQIAGVLHFIKIDAAGNEYWEKNMELYCPHPTLATDNLAKTNDGNFVFQAFDADTLAIDSSFHNVVTKIDTAANVIWSANLYEQTLNLLPVFFGGQIISTADGGTVIQANRNYHEATESCFALDVFKLDANGELLWSLESEPDDPVIFTTLDLVILSRYGGRGMVETAGGNILLQTACYNVGGFVANFKLTKLDNTGSILWEKPIETPGIFKYINDMIVGADHAVLFCGTEGGKGFATKIDTFGNIYNNKITGTVAADISNDCLLQDVEPGLGGWLVKAAGLDTFYTITNDDGTYELPLDTGMYTLNVVPSNAYWQPCLQDVPVTIVGFGNEQFFDFAMEMETLCPYLEVDISTPFLRRCFENTYFVQYCNSGTIDAEDATVEIDFDDYLTVNSASIPFTTSNGVLTFDIGNIPMNTCGNFSIQVTVDCESTLLGQTHCSTAYIFPDTICAPVSPDWSGASLSLDAACNDEEVVFSITNIGTGATTEPLQFIVIEDDIIMMEGEIPPLGVNETIVPMPLLANGATWRLEVEQVPEHPGHGNPSIAIEGCVSNGAVPSLGFVTQFAEDDANSFVSEDCQENIGSYDPNDKRAFPKGVGPVNYIEANTDLEYHIRFQNTGTDTAFHVTILDTLTEFLNVESMLPGASSHPYKYSLLANNVLKFDFFNIMLPDSNVNEAASHGFVKFRVKQQENNLPGTILNNTAAIYFDFNPPIITNVARHQVEENFLTVSTPEIISPDVAVHVFPNPAGQSASFELSLPGKQPALVQMNLYSSFGELVCSKKYRGSNFVWERNDLSGGMYFYEILVEGKVLGVGKMMLRPLRF